MIRLKALLTENERPEKASGEMIDGLSGTDKWQYWRNSDNTNWYTKKKKSNTWLDMRISLFKKYKKEEATSRWEEATAKLNKWVKDHPGDYNIITVSDSDIETFKEEPVATDLQSQLKHLQNIDYHDVVTDYKFIEMDDAIFRAKVKRNSPLIVKEITPDKKYYRVILPHRFFRKDYDIYVNVSDFDLTKDGNNIIGTYNGSDLKFEIYRPKQKGSEDKITL